MKRGTNKLAPAAVSPRVPSVALREVRGGATMIEYGLLAVHPTIPTIQPVPTPESP